MKRTFYLLILMVLGSSACNSPKSEQPTVQTEEPNKKQETYVNYEMGWSIDIPAGFTSLSENRMKVNLKKGKAAIEKKAGGTINTDSLIQLVDFQKNQFNQFSATIKRYDKKRDGDYAKNIKATREMIHDAYTKQGIKIDTASGKEIVNGLSFFTYYITLYGPNGDVVMNQVVYNRLRDGYDFGVNINYNNEVDKKTLIGAFKNSSF